jgi:hypothetical protein
MCIKNMFLVNFVILIIDEFIFIPPKEWGA